MGRLCCRATRLVGDWEYHCSQMALFFFCAVALGQFAVGAAVLCGWIVWHGCTIRDRCSGVLAPVILAGLLYVLPSWMHCFAMAEQCNWSLNISDSILALMAIGCFLAMGRADANGRNGAIERSWTNLGCVLLLGLAALRVANVSIPMLGNEIAGRALFVTVNDTAFAPIFGLLCISRVTSRRGTLIAHAAGHAAFAVLAASFAESRLLVIISLISAATLVAMAMSGDRAW